MRPVLAFHLRRQLPFLRQLTFYVLLPVVGLYALVAVQPFVPFSVLLRDANVTPYDPQDGVMFYRGALSNIGILLWWAAAVLYGFTAHILHRRGKTGAVKALCLFLAVFTGLLALDDLFMIHEEILPVRLGIPEAAMYALYGVLSAGILWFARFLLKTDFLVLVLAFVFFAISIFIDKDFVPNILSLPSGAFLLAEDLSKMLGIVCWLVFSARTTTRLV